MIKKDISTNKILQQGLLPLFFHPDINISANVLRALYAAGIRTCEYTNRGLEAPENFKQLLAIRNIEMPDLELGIGTIKSEKEAQLFIELGADFLVSPGLVPEVAELANKLNILWVPGCMTVTEIILAEKLGCNFIKLFPGNVLGPAFMSSIRELFPNLKFMPTGGVEITTESIGNWFKSGVNAVGLGSKLISKEILENEEYSLIQKNTSTALSIIKPYI